MKNRRSSGQVALGGLALAALISITAETAHAQPQQGRGSWCVVMSSQGGWIDCAYHSFAQCMAAASGVSNQCERNPWYVGPEPRPYDRRRPAERRY